MACINTNIRSRLEARAKKLEEQIALLEATQDEMLSSGVESYSFDSGEGKQSTKYRSLQQVQDALDKLYADLEAILNRLSRKGIANFKMRRNRDRDFVRRY